jgi:hypothetical protein
LDNNPSRHYLRCLYYSLFITSYGVEAIVSMAWHEKFPGAENTGSMEPLHHPFYNYTRFNPFFFQALVDTVWCINAKDERSEKKLEK